MRFLVLLSAAASLLATALPADARGLQRVREQDAAYQATQQGRIVSVEFLPGCAFGLAGRVVGRQ